MVTKEVEEGATVKSINFEDEVLRRIDELAKTHKRSRSQIVNELCKPQLGLDSVLGMGLLNGDRD